LETMSFKGTDGSTQRLVRVGCAGKTFSVFVDTDEELRKFDSLIGTMACCMGRVLRARNSAAVTPRLENVVLQNQSGWVNPTPSDMLLGCVVEGVVAIEQKKTGTFQGNPYSTVLFRAMGDVFEVKHVPQSLYVTLPDDKLSIIQIRCTTNYGLGRSMDESRGSSRLSELYLGLDSFRLLPPDEPVRSVPKEKSAA